MLPGPIEPTKKPLKIILNKTKNWVQKKNT